MKRLIFVLTLCLAMISASLSFAACPNGVGDLDFTVQSDEISVITIPNSPSLLSAKATSSSSIELTWKGNSNNEDGFKRQRKEGECDSTLETSFRIYRKVGTGTWSPLAAKGTNILSHTDTTAAGNTATIAYSYYVKACNSSGCSPATNYAVVPYKPTSLKATAVSSSRINLTWTDTSNNETGFQIYRKSGACSSTHPWSRIKTTGADITSYSNTELTPGKTYSYKIRAYTRSSAMPYAYGNSMYSNCSQATTQSDCVNIAGTWDFSESGTITCVYDGNSETGHIGGGRGSDI